jgi:hypothetical protein
MSALQVYTNPFAKVQVEPVTVSGDEIASKIAIRVQSDDGTWSKQPSILSAGYQLITNEEAKDAGDDIMSRSQMPWEEIKTHWDGRRYIGYHITKSAITSINRGGTSENHPIHLGMMVRNSYDGSSLFSIEMFIANMVCLNQYVDRNRFGYFAIRHVGDAWDVEDALGQIAIGAERAIAVVPKISALRSTPLQIEHIIKAHEQTNIPNTSWGDVLTQLSKEPDQGTVYGLFQALTFVSTHELKGLSTIRSGQSVMQWALGK